MKNTLTIPAKIKDTVPKPTKTQIIDALVERAREQHEANEEAKRLKREKIEAKMIENAVKAYTRKPSIAKIRVGYAGDVEFEISKKDAKNEELEKQRWKFSYDHFQEWSVRKQIKEKLSTPNPLLGNKEVEKQLDQLIASIMGKPKAIEEQEVEVVTD